VAPLRLGGRRGKQSTSRVWLGGTGERSTVGEQERRGSKGQGTERRTSSDAGEATVCSLLMKKKMQLLLHYTLFQDICNRRIQIVYSSCLVSFRMLEFCGSLKNLI
jgi:hypothetical protein